MSFACRVCGSIGEHRVHSAREMMFGSREPFNYFECTRCGTVQICHVPELDRFYPAGYFAFDRKIDFGRTFAKRMAARFAGKYLLKNKSVIGKLIVALRPGVTDHFPASLCDNRIGIDLNSRILDFGCGNGRLLQTLSHFGFRDLTGADAFIESDIVYPSGVRIYKRGLSELEGPFDLIMLHHSFEHLIDPNETLAEIKRLLAPAAYCLIRMPVINTAWELYGVNWVQMDPPRHLILYTEASFRSLAEKAGFVVEYVMYDSTAFQFWGSEQYLRDIPLNDPRSHFDTNEGSLFTTEQMKAWEEQARTLNAGSRGDQACFYLQVKGR